MSQVTTRRIYRKLNHREVAFVPIRPTLRETLAECPPDRDTYVLYLLGNAPDDWLTWSATGPHEGGAHYLDGSSVVLRYPNDGHGGYEVHEASSWFGEGDYTAAEAQAAYEALQEVIGRAFDGATILATPATTGRELFLRTIPWDTEYQVLDAETQELIRATDGQGRIEVVAPPPGHWDGGNADEMAQREVALVVPELHEYDARFAYAALCWELPVGPVHRDDVNRYEGAMRGRYRVRGQVPTDWAEPFGLLGVKDAQGGWYYPHALGETFETWADGAELHVALQHGWRFEILERLLFPEVARPLDTWAKKLVNVRTWMSDPEWTLRLDPAVVEMVRTAIRNIVLQAIGAFHGRPHVETHMVPLERANEVPANARRPRRGGPGKEWIIYGLDAGQGWANLAHPEWSACVWGRGRARLLSAPKSQGALNREAGTHVVGFRTDAIYLTGAQPEWDAADDGAPGRYRSKGALRTRSAWPRNGRELLELKASMA